mmetsp:Transcript_2244/g.7505  ORF Transcript_2244/g.7505 Transcript_2244/m.7505 type:complete len:229 (+) Transcript_2244:651-1337(+)
MLPSYPSGRTEEEERTERVTIYVFFFISELPNPKGGAPDGVVHEGAAERHELLREELDGLLGHDPAHHRRHRVDLPSAAPAELLDVLLRDGNGGQTRFRQRGAHDGLDPSHVFLDAFVELSREVSVGLPEPVGRVQHQVHKRVLGRVLAQQKGLKVRALRGAAQEALLLLAHRGEPQDLHVGAVFAETLDVIPAQSAGIGARCARQNLDGPVEHPVAVLLGLAVIQPL